MRLYESLSYGNNNSNNHANIDRLSVAQANGNTVKTFTSNGNQQSQIDSAIASLTTADLTTYFELESGDDVNSDWGTNLNNVLSSNDTIYYGSHRKLKSRDNIIDDNANGNAEFESSPKDTVDLIDGSSPDIEAEITRLINRSNLCRQNFESESHKDCAPTEELMDEEEEFSSLSISASLSVDKVYPRGIINPNYPGFQHLAHTLSEHFVDHHNNAGSMSDSDFSEVDSDFPSEGHSSDNNNTFACDDSNGNIIEAITTKSDNLSTVEEILRTVFESNSSHLTSAIEILSEKERVDELTDIDDLTDIDACDLNTYLDRYDSGIDIEHVEEYVKKMASPVNEPDLVQKSICERSAEQTVDKPDILLDVAEDGATLGVGEKDEPGSAWSITPVDIVGNFEQEVERELGLLVNGYRSNSFTSESDEVDGINEQFLDKTTDAVLSDANDTIAKISILDNRNSVNNEITMKTPIPTAIVKPKYQRSSFDDRQLPAVAYMNDNEAAWYDKSSATEMNKCSAPVTAPQTKKIHLSEFDRKAKKHVSLNGAKSTHNEAKPTTENTQIAIVSDGRAVSKRSVVQKSKTSGASVAVVQPRKKERMDSKLMETIVQMQIKKNAQLYRGQGKLGSMGTTVSHSVTHLNNVNNNKTGENINVANQAKKEPKENSGCFDVYNIETALPVIDMETIENHLKLVKEGDRRKRNDREEIRRRLAMGAEDDYLTKISAKPGRKPSLQTRLQEGKKLQICFVNDAATADADSFSSDSESCPKLSKPVAHSNQSTVLLSRNNNTTAQPNPYNSRPLSVKKTTSQEKALTLEALKTDEDPKEIDFFTKQARLQIEARMALAQAKDIAHMQMEMERQKRMESPITNMIRSTIEKVGYNFPADKRRVSRQMLTDMNVAQLQIIVNDFHTQIESLNEQLVKYLMDRDDLHMGQDSMLVDIEDLTRYLGAKKDPYSNERKKPTKRYHSMRSPKYQVSQKYPQHRLASQIGKT